MEPVGLLYVVRSLVDFGGMENACYRILTRLDRNKYTPYVVTVEGKGPVAEPFEAEGIPVVDIPAYPSKWKCARGIQRFCREHDIRIVHAHLRPAVTIARLAGRMARVPVVLCHDHSNRDYAKTWRSFLIDRVIGRFCEPTICLSQDGADWEAEHSGLRGAQYYRIIPNGISRSEYHTPVTREAARELLGLPQDVKIVCYSGRMYDVKNVEQIVRAFAEPELAGVHLALAGDGRDRPACEAAARELNIADRMHFLGSLEDPRPVYRASDAMAFASGEEEGQGLVLLEAMATGTPVASTKVGLMVMPETVGDEYALITEPKPGPIAKGVAEALDPERAKELVVAANRLLEKFTMERQVRETEEYYEEMLARKRGRRKPSRARS